MAQIIEVPGVGQVEFPDGMSDAAISSAIKSHLMRSGGVSKEASALAAKDVGIGEAALIGMGRGFDKLKSGVQQLGLGAVSAIAPKNFAEAADKSLADLKAEQQTNDQAFKGLSDARPYATGIGEALPYMATGSMGILPSALTVAGFEAAKYGTPQERAINGALGGATTALGGVAGKFIGNAINPVAEGARSATKQSALDAAKSIGYQPRLSEVTGSPFFGRLEDMAARAPGGAGVMQDFAQGNQKAINRAAAKSIGEVSDEMGAKTFADASGRLSKVFEDVKALPGKPIAINQNVASVADDIITKQGKMIPGQRDAALESLAKTAKALAQNNGKIDGEAYQLARSGLSEAAFDAAGTNRNLYGKLLGALDDSAEQSLNAIGQNDLAAALRSARPQYANLKTLEKGATAEAGNISPAKVASSLRTSNPKAFREGKMQGNPLYDIAQIGENMKPLTAGSPTFERTMAASPIQSALLSPFAYGAAQMTTNPLFTAYPRFIGGTQGAQIAGRLANPAVRSIGSGALNYPFGALLPIMSEKPFAQ